MTSPPTGGHRLTIFDRAGSPLAVLQDIYADRSWHMRDSGQVTLVIAKSHPKATQQFLAYRNLVLIENDILPKWTGFFWPPRQETATTITMTALSAERLFQFRKTGPNDVLSGAGGALAAQLVTIANSVEDTGISAAAGDIEAIGGALSKTYHLENVYKQLVKLAEETNMFWWVDGSKDAGSRLTMALKWRSARGIVFPTLLEEGWNLEIDDYAEDGDPVSSLTVYGKTDDWASPIMATATSASAQSSYGLVEDVVGSMESEDAGTVTTIAAALIAQRSLLRREVGGYVSRPPYPAIGDVCDVWLKKFGWGTRLTMTLYDAAWDAQQARLEVKFRERT